MTTFTDIATDALLTLGVYAPGESISAADMSQAFTTFNDMIDFFATQNLMSYANVEQSFTLVPGDNQYPIGPTGQILQARPMEILGNPGAVRVVDPQGTNYPVMVVDQFAFNNLSAGTIAGSNVVNSNTPDILFYDPQFPNGVINLWPTPTMAWTLYFQSKLIISEAATLTSAISLPPGYNLMLKRNLAKWLLPYFGDQLGQLAMARVVADAKETLAQIKRRNIKIPLSTFDSGIVTKGVGTFNIQTYGR